MQINEIDLQTTVIINSINCFQKRIYKKKPNYLYPRQPGYHLRPVTFRPHLSASLALSWSGTNSTTQIICEKITVSQWNSVASLAIIQQVYRKRLQYQFVRVGIFIGVGGSIFW